MKNNQKIDFQSKKKPLEIRVEKNGNDLKNSNFAYCVLIPGKLETFFLYMGRHFEVAPNISHQAF